MESPSGTSEAHELSRIRGHYAQRQKNGLDSRYSFLRPEFVLLVHEREQGLLSMLSQHGVDSLKEKKVLEIGCGSGHWLRAFLQWGVVPQNLFGIDLLPERIEEARRTCPPDVHLECGNAASLGFPDRSFDLVLQSTVFTSILDSWMKQRIAAEMLRLLRPRGFVLWYDFHVNNPRNPDVRGIRKREIQELFPRCRIHLRRTTLAPPIARLVGPGSALLYMVLSQAKILCTHYLGLIERD